jgi:hypothetical protein
MISHKIIDAKLRNVNEITMTRASYSREQVQKDLFMLPELHSTEDLFILPELHNNDDMFMVHAT